MEPVRVSPAAAATFINNVKAQLLAASRSQHLVLHPAAMRVLTDAAVKYVTRVAGNADAPTRHHHLSQFLSKAVSAAAEECHSNNRTLTADGAARALEYVVQRSGLTMATSTSATVAPLTSTTLAPPSPFLVIPTSAVPIVQPSFSGDEYRVGVVRVTPGSLIQSPSNSASQQQANGSHWLLAGVASTKTASLSAANSGGAAAVDALLSELQHDRGWGNDRGAPSAATGMSAFVRTSSSLSDVTPDRLLAIRRRFGLAYGRALRCGRFTSSAGVSQPGGGAGTSGQDPSLAASTTTSTAAGGHRVTPMRLPLLPLTSLEGVNTQQRVAVVGMLCRRGQAMTAAARLASVLPASAATDEVTLMEESWALEDPEKCIPLIISASAFAKLGTSAQDASAAALSSSRPLRRSTTSAGAGGFVHAGMIVIAEGEWNGAALVAHRISRPPCEPRSLSLVAIGGVLAPAALTSTHRGNAANDAVMTTHASLSELSTVDTFGGQPPDVAVAQRQLLAAQQAALIVLSNIYLDQPSTMEYLATFFRELQSRAQEMNFAHLTLVLVGRFSSVTVVPVDLAHFDDAAAMAQSQPQSTSTTTTTTPAAASSAAKGEPLSSTAGASSSMPTITPQQFSGNFDLLSAVIYANAPKVASEAQIVLIPGPGEYGTVSPPGVYPTGPLADAFVTQLKRRCPRLVLASNPCRIRCHTQEIIVCRDDLHSLLSRQATMFKAAAAKTTTIHSAKVGSGASFSARPPNIGEADDDHGPNQSSSPPGKVPFSFADVVRTVVDCAHLRPFIPQAAAATNSASSSSTSASLSASTTALSAATAWSQDHLLQLFPLPHVLVLCDQVHLPWVTKYGGCSVFGPGTFATSGTFLWYTPADGEGAFSSVA